MTVPEAKEKLSAATKDAVLAGVALDDLVDSIYLGLLDGGKPSDASTVRNRFYHECEEWCEV